MVSSDEAERVGGAALVGGLGEVTAPPGERQTLEEGEGGTNEEIRTMMEGKEVGGD